MLIPCITKGCRKTSEAKYDKDTGDVICEECGNAITNITQFTKKALLSLGQVLRSKTKQPFQALCKNCNSMRSLFIRSKSACCGTCKKKVEVSAAFLNGLKQHLDAKKEEKKSE